MKFIFDYKFRFYTSKMNEICLHCHWLYFSSIIMSFGQGVHIVSYNLGHFFFSNSRIHILPNYGQTNSKTAIVHSVSNTVWPSQDSKRVLCFCVLLIFRLILNQSLQGSLYFFYVFVLLSLCLPTAAVRYT